VFRDHPVLWALVGAGVALGAAAGFVWLPDDWSLVRRLLAGGVAGGGVGFLIVATRLF
jgi:hypothetical protein